MRRSLWKTTAGLLLVSIISLAAEANDLFQADVSAGCGVMAGNTEYRVGGKIKTTTGNYDAHFPVSKLDFPIYACLLSLHARITVKDRLTCSVSWGTDLANDPDKLRDYDWQTSPETLSVYSESSLDMGADIFSGKIQYSVLQIDLNQYSSFFNPGDRWQMLAGAGYLYRQLDFKAYDTLQTYPGQRVNNDYVSGWTLNYSVEYQIPFLELGMLVEVADGTTAELSVGYSPLVEATDEDHHLLRSLLSKSDCEGKALMFSFNYNYNFLNHWYAALFLSHLKIEAEGTSQTFINGSWDHSIETKIESRQFLAALELGMKF